MRIKGWSTTLLLVALIALCGSIGEAQETAIFLNFQSPAIPGDATDAAHVDWVDVYTLSEEISIPVTLGGGGGGRQVGSPEFPMLTITKGFDRASVPLRGMLTNNLPEVVIEVCRQPGALPQQCFLRITLDNVIIESFTDSALSCVIADACSGEVSETLGLNFTRIRWRYTRFDAAGNPIGSFEEGWDLMSNTQT